MKADELVEAIRSEGVAGAGGAGFPAYAKWKQLENVDYFLMNHQESEPGFYGDKWLGRTHPELFASLFDLLLDHLDCVVIGAKATDREWCKPLEEATDATVYPPSELPVDPTTERGNIVFAYTPPKYSFSEEQMLLMAVARLDIGTDLPTDHGWLVHNTESTANIARALDDGTPVTHKLVHIYGETPRHRLLCAPVGTTVPNLLAAAGTDPHILDKHLLADGGPGWCYAVDTPETFGVRKRTNALLVLDESLAREHEHEDGRINVREARDWGKPADHETTPMTIEVDEVRVPLITNQAYTGLVNPSIPTVEVGDSVKKGERVARPDDGISIPQHTPIDGAVTEITELHVIVER